jgi:hypothetical protein
VYCVVELDSEFGIEKASRMMRRDSECWENVRLHGGESHGAAGIVPQIILHLG